MLKKLNCLDCVRWLFSLYIGEDANFRMVRKRVSSEAADPTLSPGWALFCEYIKYNGHISKYGPQVEQVSGRLLVNFEQGVK